MLVALGRPPNVDALKLERAGVKVDRGGAVVVDEFQNTSAAGIYAIGDVISGAISLTPVAIRAGRILAHRLFGQQPDLKMNYNNVATAVFSHPPICTVGLNEEDAKKKYGDKVVVFKSNFVNMIYSPVDGHPLFINPNLTYSIAQNLDVNLIVQVLMQGDGKSYTSPTQVGYLRLKWSF